MADFEKNIKKALAGMKPTDMTKMKPIDPKIQKIFEKIIGPSSKAKK